MDEVTAPHDDVAERQTLGALLHLDPKSDDAHYVWEHITAADFYRPAHVEIANAVERLAGRGDPVEPGAVVTELLAGGLLERVGGPAYVADLYTRCSNPTSGGFYAARVGDASRKRQVVEIAQRLLQRASTDGEVDLVDLVTQARDDLDVVGLIAGVTGPRTGIEDMAAFLDRPRPAKRWLVPDLIARRDRIVYTAGEGAGKSMLSRQVAVTVAAGLHPFSRDPIDGGVVLVVDCENDEDDNAEHYRRMCRQASTDGAPVRPGRLSIAHKPAGLNLLDPRDRKWLASAVVECSADLLVIGPLYKLTHGKTNEEENARLITASLDSLRARFGVGVVMEAHSGHATDVGGKRAGRPRGSAVLLGWPEVGLGMHLADEPYAQEMRLMDITPWRGFRGPRAWPSQIRGGATWPWDAA